MKVPGSPTVKEFLLYFYRIMPSLLLGGLFYCIVHCYNFQNGLVLIPVTVSIFLLYTFFGQSEEDNEM